MKKIHESELGQVKVARSTRRREGGCLAYQRED